MRKLILLTLALALAAIPACKRKRHPNPMATVEEDSQLSSVVSMADTAAVSQLLSGFHALEQGAWRWTMKRFAVSLAVSDAARTRGGRIEVKAVIPEVAAAQMTGAALTASIDGEKLGPFRFDRAGEQTAVFDVPAKLLNQMAVAVDFELDRAIEPSGQETRELGLIILQVSLAAK